MNPSSYKSLDYVMIDPFLEIPSQQSLIRPPPPHTHTQTKMGEYIGMTLSVHLSVCISFKSNLSKKLINKPILMKLYTVCRTGPEDVHEEG